MVEGIVLTLALAVVSLPLVVGFLLMSGVLLFGIGSALMLFGKRLSDIFDETEFRAAVHQRPHPAPLKRSA